MLALLLSAGAAAAATAAKVPTLVFPVLPIALGLSFLLTALFGVLGTVLAIVLTLVAVRLLGARLGRGDRGAPLPG